MERSLTLSFHKPTAFQVPHAPRCCVSQESSKHAPFIISFQHQLSRPFPVGEPPPHLHHCHHRSALLGAPNHVQPCVTSLTAAHQPMPQPPALPWILTSVPRDLEDTPPLPSTVGPSLMLWVPGGRRGLWGIISAPLSLFTLPQAAGARRGQGAHSALHRCNPVPERLLGLG